MHAVQAVVNGPLQDAAEERAKLSRASEQPSALAKLNRLVPCAEKIVAAGEGAGFDERN